MQAQLIEHICEHMRGWETDQLLKMWMENDRDQWSPEAFEAVKVVLAERGVAIPAQARPVIPVPGEGFALEYARPLPPTPRERVRRWVKEVIVWILILMILGLVGFIAEYLSVPHR